MAVTPTGAPVMVAYIAERNVSSMISSSVLAVLAISLTIALVLRSLKLGLLSLVATGLPILATFGLWGLAVGSVGFSIAAVASVSMGIIVDDTVHILTKYVRIRQETKLLPQDAIRKVISTVGYALVGNSLILLCGFMILTLSTFKVNVDMGLLTSLTIILALAFNFLLVGPVLCLKQKAE
jgi:predicted RND superfamily exporter protein